MTSCDSGLRGAATRGEAFAQEISIPADSGVVRAADASSMADDISKRIARFIEPFRVSPGSSVKLARDFDPGFKAGIEKKEGGVDLLKDGIGLLTEYQARLAAQGTYGVLVVLQALDAAGEDGTIRHVMSGVNPVSARPHALLLTSSLAEQRSQHGRRLDAKDRVIGCDPPNVLRG